MRGEEKRESALIYMNDKPVGINTPLEPNCEIIIEPSTEGRAAVRTLEQLEEYTASSIDFMVNGHVVHCPRLLEVNGSLGFRPIRSARAIRLRCAVFTRWSSLQSLWM